MIWPVIKNCWKPLTLIVLVVASLWGAYSVGYNSADKSWQLEWAKRDKADSDALAQRHADERTEEQRRQKEIDGIRVKSASDLAKVQATADAANSFADSLHTKADRLAKRLAKRERSCNPNSSLGGKTNKTGAELLAELFRKADNRAGELARIADEARARGLACEAAYESLRKKP